MAARPRNPSIVVYPGAWHVDACMADFLASLQKLDYAAEAHTLPSVGSSTKGIDDDATDIRSKLESLMEDDGDVVLIAHSYAGFPATVAISGMDRESRKAQHLRGGLRGVIYLNAFVPKKDDSLHTFIGGKWEPWVDEHESDGVLLVTPDDRREVFYADCSEEAAEQAQSQLRSQSTKSFKDVMPGKIGWAEDGFQGRRAYVQGTEDKAIPLLAQKMFTEQSGVEWIVKSLDGSSHSPFLSRPDELAKTVAEMVSQFPPG